MIRFGISQKLFAMASLILVTPAMQSCSDEEVAVGAAVVAVGATVVAVDSAVDARRDRRRDDHCRERWERQCRPYYDYYGHRRQECHQVRVNRCHGGHHRHYFLEAMDQGVTEATEAFVATEVDNLVDGSDFAVAHGMSGEAGKRMVEAMEQARSGDLNGILELGLTREDAQNLAQLKMPSEGGIDALAQSLNQAPTATRSMLYKMIAHGYKVKQVECKKGEASRLSAELCAQP